MQMRFQKCGYEFPKDIMVYGRILPFAGRVDAEQHAAVARLNM